MRTSIDGISLSQPTNRRSDYERRLVVPTRSIVNSTPTAVQTIPKPVQKIHHQPTLTVAPKLRYQDIRPGTSRASDEAKTSPSVVTTREAQPVPDKNTLQTPAPEKVVSKKRSWFTQPHVVRWSFSTLAVLILAITGVLGYQTWQTNAQAHAVLNKPISATVGGTASSADDAAPSQAPVTPAAKKAYTVAPDMPRMLSIPSIGVSARILRLSVTNDGAIQAPNSIWDTGWYDGSAKPGEKGNAFIDGHISYPGTPAVFTKLHSLKNGAVITIQRGDGSNLTYTVVSVTTQKLSDINMASILAGPGGADQTLTIMTCAGTIKANEFDSRTVVTAKLAA